jgi:hypothetical protein
MQLRMISQNGNNLDFLDALTIFSVILQTLGYQNDMSQSSNDDLLRELQRQDRVYLDKIVDNQKRILSILSEMNTDMSAE